MNVFRIIAIITVALLFAYNAAAQDDKICISREAAETCAENALKVKALEDQIKALEQALKDKDGIITDLKIDNAFKTGQITACQQNEASNRAIIAAMIPMLRQKTNGIKIF